MRFRHCRYVFPLGIACGVVLRLVPAHAMAPETCVGPKVSALVPPGAEWDSATSDLTRRLRELTNLDPCARMTIRPQDVGAVVEVTTSDGRQAARRVNSVKELLAAAEALLVLPPAPQSHPASVARSSPLESPPVDRTPLKAEVPPTHVELGAGGCLRFGGGPLYSDGGVVGFADFVLDHWLLAVTGRWDIAAAFVNEPTPRDFKMRSNSVGVGVGRRFEIDNTNLDVMLGPNLILETQDADDGQRDVHGAAGDFRLAVSLKVSGPRSSSVRAFAVGDFEASPARVRSLKYIDRSLPSLPWWSSGVAVGILWGAQ